MCDNHAYSFFLCFFFNDTATTEIYTLSLHDALPIYIHMAATMTESALLSGTPKRDTASGAKGGLLRAIGEFGILCAKDLDRKSTRLNSSHANISYAVFCLKKKNKTKSHHSSFTT